MKAGQASATARLIAAAQVMAMRKPALRGLVDPESAELCGRMLMVNRKGRLLLGAARTRMGRGILRLIERVVAPGLIRHWLNRKQAIERLVRDAMTEGFTQLLVIGAGLDTLPLRLAFRGEVKQAVCVDHPATQAIVLAAFPEFTTTSNLRLIAADLSEQDLMRELHCTNAMFDVPTIVIAEGFLMYLTREQVNSLLRRVAGLPVPRVRAILTAMDSPAGEPIGLRPRRRIAERWLKRQSEPMRSSIPIGTEAAELDAAGLTHICTITSRELRRDSSLSAVEGENIIIGER